MRFLGGGFNQTLSIYTTSSVSFSNPSLQFYVFSRSPFPFIIPSLLCFSAALSFILLFSFCCLYSYYYPQFSSFLYLSLIASTYVSLCPFGDVVYFNQRTSAWHAVCWLKSVFCTKTIFCILLSHKMYKITKKLQNIQVLRGVYQRLGVNIYGRNFRRCGWC